MTAIKTSRDTGFKDQNGKVVFTNVKLSRPPFWDGESGRQYIEFWDNNEGELMIHSYSHDKSISASNGGAKDMLALYTVD